MNQELIAFLSGLVSAMQATQACGLDISEMVVGLIQHKLSQITNPDEFVLSTGQQLVRPNRTEIDTGRFRSKLDMIKEYKNRTGYSLMDSKRMCEEFFDFAGYEFYRRS